MKVTAVVPVKEREALLPYTIGRLVRQCFKVICVGQTQSECDVCESVGADFYYCDNGMMLGKKWQHAVTLAKKDSPDALLIMGSASMISDNWIETLGADLKSYAMTGAAGIHYLHFTSKDMKIVKWNGYNGGRSNEPIGVGRMISKAFLDSNGWNLFSKVINGGCDHSTWNAVKAGKGKVNVNKSEDIYSLRISSYKWLQKNSFDRMSKLAGSKLVDDSVLEYFPEIKDMKL